MPHVRNSFAIRALVIGFAALLAAAPAKACDERGCFGGVQGWGGIFRDNRDPGWFPTYVAVSGWDWGANVWVIAPPPIVVYPPAPARPLARPQTHSSRAKTRRHRRASLSCAAQRPCFCCH
jgi:hypothetical protein